MESSYQSKTGLVSPRQAETVCHRISASFRQAGLLEVALSKYPSKFHNFKYLIFMTSSLKALFSSNQVCTKQKLLQSNLDYPDFYSGPNLVVNIY